MDQISIIHQNLRSVSHFETYSPRPIINESHFPLIDFFSSPQQIWKTCLRNIGFLPRFKDNGEVLSSQEVKNKFDLWLTQNQKIRDQFQLLQNEDAIAFLISVLCGLESPVLGETEVLGQFRNFIGSNHQLNANHAFWHQFILTEVKNLRTSSIKHLGSNSYGSLLRKELKDFDQVLLIGSGQFAKEILPWLKEILNVQIYCRRKEIGLGLLEQNQIKGEVFDSLDLVKLRQILIAKNVEKSQKNAVIVAAPLSDAEILNIIPQLSTTLIDCRGNEVQFNSLDRQKTFFRCTKNYIDLQKLTAQLEVDNFSRKDKVSEIKAQIQIRTSAYFDKPRIRPLGWEDLHCA